MTEFGRIVRAGVAAGADLIFFETFTDLYELKAALLAAKENSTLPILASMSFEAGGRTFTGCTVESFAATARGLGADAIGINCSLGPKEIFPMAKRLAEAVPGSFPVFVKPNAGLPRADGSGYDITPAALWDADEALPGAEPVRGGRLLRHHAGVHPTAERCLCRLQARPPRPPDEVGHLLAGELRQCGRHHGGGRADQPHRQKSGSNRPCGKMT